ncbi:MAG: gas vesicle protein [Candidatus Hatepunaea meridiana]|nr:gas vesicle protein [Candidatus Hatepunaea meridiana]
MTDHSNLNETEHVSICELLDRVLNKGVVVIGDVTLSVAGIDLIYLELQLILTNIKTIQDELIPKELKS